MDYIRVMGAIRVTVAVINPADPTKIWDGLFLVDSSVSNCVAPAKHLRAIGIVPQAKRRHGFADGREIDIDIAVARVEFMGEVIGTTMIFGEDDVEPILGS